MGEEKYTDERIERCIKLAWNGMKSLVLNLMNTNVPVQMNTFIYCPGWTGTAEGQIDCQVAEDIFWRGGMKSLFTSFYVAYAVPADDGNTMLYLCDVVGSMQIEDSKVKLKNNERYCQAMEKIAKRVCHNAGRFWIQNAPTMDGLVSVVTSPGYVGIYVAMNDAGRVCNRERIRKRRIANSPKGKKATALPAPGDTY